MNRKQARENAFILLFENASRSAATPDEIVSTVMETRPETEIDDYVKDVLFGVAAHAEEIEALFESNLKGWKKARVSIVSTAIIRLALYEMLYREDVPTKVAINEAIELSKKFDDDKAYIFVNGVLNGAAEEKGLK